MLFFTAYPSCYPLDAYVVMCIAGEAPPGHGFWVQLFEDVCSRLIQPVRLVAWSQTHIMLILWRTFCLSLFRWLIHISTLRDPWILIKVIIRWLGDFFEENNKDLCITLMQRLGFASPFQKINILWTSEATNITTVVQNLRHYQIVTKFSKRPLTCRLQVAHLDWECPPAYTHAYLTICCQGATSHAPTLAANIDWYQCVSKGRTVWHYKHNKVYHWVLHCTKVYSIINISHEKHQIILSIWLDI
jgi:hypothetical protein